MFNLTLQYLEKDSSNTAAGMQGQESSVQAKKNSWIEQQEEVGEGRVLLYSIQLLLFRR